MTNPGFTLLCLIPFLMTIGQAAAMDEANVCYILDGVLFIYGLVLTILYCRMKIQQELAKNRLLQRRKHQRESMKDFHIVLKIPMRP